MFENTNESIDKSVTEMLAELQALKDENARLKAAPVKALGLKVSEKGAISVYGLQRFPVTLYVGQMERLLGESERIKSFIVDNADKLKRDK